jgi:hypothetical protein
VAAVAVAFGPWLGRNLIRGAAVAAVVAGLAGPLAYSVQTITTPHTGSTPTAGPSISGGGFSGRSGGFPGRSGGFPGNFRGGQSPTGINSTNPSAGKSGAPGFGSFKGNNFGNFKQGGFSGGSEATPGKAIVKLLQQDASNYTWVAATVRATSSAPYQLETGDPIMDIGGFLGSDPAPTLSEFKKYVNEGKIHYFISGGMNSGRGFKQMGGNFANGNANGNTNGNTTGGNFQNGAMGGGSNSSSSITNWVQKNFKSKTVDGVTVYDLTQSKS